MSPDSQPAPIHMPRLQLSVVHLLAMTVCVFVGVQVGTPLCKYLLRNHNDTGTAVFAALLISLTGLGLALLRLSRESSVSRPIISTVLTYSLVCWLLSFTCWELGFYSGLLTLCTIAPGVVWSVVQSERKGYASFALEGRLFVTQVITWLGLLAIVVFCSPPRFCCDYGGESAAISACKTYAEAQDIYRRTDWDNDGVLEYALTVSGANSLYEKIPGTGDLTLVDAAFANASLPANAQPKAGYYFKVLTGQGSNAPGGSKSYIENGNMTKGYALVAWPAEYDGLGRNTYIINNTGTVYQKDLGPDTVKLVEQLTEYDPGPGWVVSE